ncbi:MAG: cell wall-associated NlpC family hydrolase [Verrucomicrobiales bacterium]|jgi:cell wall-associated NlpC family hydrolase
MTIRRLWTVSIAICAALASAAVAAPPKKANVGSLSPSDIREFNEQPAQIQQLLKYSLGLTKKNLRYQYGSCDPASGGMDCSGTVHHVLNHLGFNAPRASNTLYLWVEKAGNLRKVRNAKNIESTQLRHLKPGDLLFWEGTYNVGKRKPPTSHVMIFVGHRKSDGKPVAVGASSGRYYAGKARHGVSMFDFVMPRAGSTSKFVGYGPVPGMEKAAKAEAPREIVPPIVARVIAKVEEKILPEEPKTEPVTEPKPAPESGRVVVAEYPKPPAAAEPENQPVEESTPPKSAPKADPKLTDGVLKRIRKMEAELDAIKGKIKRRLP